MRRAQIVNLAGSFGTMQHENIWKQVQRRKLDGLFLDMRIATREDLDFIAGRFLRPGLIVEPGWFTPPLSGHDLAEYAHRRLSALGFAGAHARELCDVCFNNERQDPADILAMIRRWRQLRFLRATQWAIQPFQSGWFTDELVAVVNSDVDLAVVGEAYFGPSDHTQDMDPVAHDAVKDNLVNRGIRRDRAKIAYGTFYKDEHGNDVELPIFDGWDGILFNLDKT